MGAETDLQLVPLPPVRLRMGGQHFMDDSNLIAAAVRDVETLRRYAGLESASRVLDWGCGAGRLAIGIKTAMGQVANYHGVDVQPELIAWAHDNLAGPGFHFTLVHDSNGRYNPSGETTRSLPADDESVDVFYAYSVFSHMEPEDVSAYAREIARVLSPDGRAFLTCFVEDGVPPHQVNPVGYGPLPWEGALHCVLYNRAAFDERLRAEGLAVEHYAHGQETDGQSSYVLSRRAANPK